MDDAVTNFISSAVELSCAAYHLHDEEWIIPTLKKYRGSMDTVYYDKPKIDTTNRPVISELKSKTRLKWHPRSKTNIMHDKFIVKIDDGKPSEVLTGTANFTTEGLTSQANVIHTFESAELAGLYASRQKLLRSDPAVKATAAGANWSKWIPIGSAGTKVRVFFPPEPKSQRVSIDAVVNAVKAAKSSAIFSLFSATDAALLDACFSSADRGMMMFGLVNQLSEPHPKDGAKENASTIAAVKLYNRSSKDVDVIGHDMFHRGDVPFGFWSEVASIQKPGTPTSANGKKKKYVPQVYVHNKYIVIDGETEHPTVFCGSANMSSNSTWHNDENLLQLTGCPRISESYIAEFIRLFEHYRARVAWNRASASQDHNASETFRLTDDSSWAGKFYKAGTAEYKARIRLS
jgi:phosphatidylserine/phosphatidylglycerophosphate/cardiolipin synthase-like enzyme